MAVIELHPDDVEEYAAGGPYADVTPETHVFSLREWRLANPNGDPEEARREAQRLGFEVVA